jgi:hypothetical protein
LAQLLHGLSLAKQMIFEEIRDEDYLQKLALSVKENPTNRYNRANILTNL